MRDYQQDGFVNGIGTKSLAEANRQLSVAKRSTPEALREQYRSQIRTLVSQGGIAWYWVRK